MMKVYIAGMGVVSSLGTGLSENWESLISQRHGINSFSEELDPLLKGFPVGKVNHTDGELADMVKSGKNLPRTVYLSMLAAKEAVQNTGLELSKYRTGLISATTTGGIDLSEKFFSFSGRNTAQGSLSNVINHECGRVTDLVAGKIGANSYVSTISTACSSSANSIILGARLIRMGRLDVVIAGGGDALTAFTLNGFNTLLLLDPNLSLPFDAGRNGLNIGEGAAYVVLVSERLADAGLPGLSAVLSGYSNVCDAYHQTALSPEGNGPYLSMTAALAMAGIDPLQVDYINAHGTATQNNDASEGAAMCRLFANKMPAFSSTKSYTGHTLGASGAIEAVFSLLALSNNKVFPNLRFRNPMPGLDLTPLTEVKELTVNNVISNSFGFGGNCSSLVFSKIRL